MPIEFACASCGRTYKAPESVAGKRVRCKSCGSVVQVPQPGDTGLDVYGLDDEPTAAAEPEMPRLPAATPRRRRSRPSGAGVASPAAGDASSRPYMNGVGAMR